jgi:hypothetical protein
VHARLTCRLALLATRRTALRNGTTLLQRALTLLENRANRATFLAAQLGAIAWTEEQYRSATQLLRSTAATRRPPPANRPWRLAGVAGRGEEDPAGAGSQVSREAFGHGVQRSEIRMSEIRKVGRRFVRATSSSDL